jgi:hypothetical protein
MSFEYCRSASAANWAHRRAAHASILRRSLVRYASTRPPSWADTMTSSGGTIKFITPGFNPEAAT